MDEAMNTSSNLADRQARLIIDSAVDYAIVGIDLEGVITSWNAGAERIMGWRAEEAIGRSVDLFFTPEDVEARISKAEMTAAVRHGRGIDERWHLRQDGSRFWANGEMMPLRNEDGDLEGYVKILRDRTEQHYVKVALSETEEGYQTLYDAIDQGFCLIEVRCDIASEPIDYRYLEVNAAFERQTGLVDAPGNWMRDLAPDHEQHWFDIYAKVAVTGEPMRFTLPAQALDSRWYDGLAYKVGEPDERRVAILFSDVSEQRASEARLRCSEERLRTLNATLRESEARLAALVHASSEVRYSMNADWSEMRQLSGSGFLAETSAPNTNWMAEYIHPDDQSAVRAAIDEAVQKKITFQFEHRVRKADGSIGWTSSRAAPIFDGEGNITDWFGAASDITEQRHAEAELARVGRLRLGLAELGERLRFVDDITALQIAAVELIGTVLGAARVGYGSVSSDMEILTVSSEWSAAGSQSHAGAYKLDNYGGQAADLRKGSTVVINDVTSDPRTAADTEPLMALSIGSLINYPVVEQGRTVAILYINDPQPRMWRKDEVAFVRDAADRLRQTTERRRAEVELRELNSRLEAEVEARTRELIASEEALRQSQKMEAIGHLTGGIAHDFNNLLTAVTGGLELLGARIAKGEYDKLDRYINMAQTGANRAAALTQRLLAFSRRQTLAPTPTDADRLVAGMEEIIDRTLGPSIEVEVVATAGLWPILVDAPQLENTLLNLCINARDAMPEGGRLTIETGNKVFDAQAAADHDLAAGEYVSLSVADTGSGMTSDVIARVFDPFFTTKPIGEGTGLGLSMVYGFVRQSGGQVRISSEPGQGTTMCLFLPRYLGAVAAHDDDRNAADPMSAVSGETVLVVEDEVMIRVLMADVLIEAGYRVLEAGTGPAGVKVMESDERIDLLLTDVGLPGGLNGRQVADAGRVIRPGLKVLFVTGYAANAAIGAGHLDNRMEVLTKPFNTVELANRVRALIEA